MGAKDITEKILEDYNEVFADIVNVLVFNGEKRVTPDSLQSTSTHSMYKADTRKLHEQERDISKIWSPGNVKFALCGIENQTKDEERMPLRIAGYEGSSYRSQLEEGKIVPVITIILYYGTRHWNQPMSIKDLIDIPEGMEDYVNDTKIHVFEISWLTQEQIDMFESDFKIVANFFVEKRKNKDYIPDDKTEIKHVDEVLKLLSVMTGDNRYETILVSPSKKEVMTMCEVAERLEQKGRAEGRVEGREEEKTENITRMLKSGKMPEQIADFCGYELSEVLKVQKTLLSQT